MKTGFVASPAVSVSQWPDRSTISACLCGSLRASVFVRRTNPRRERRALWTCAAGPDDALKGGSKDDTGDTESPDDEPILYFGAAEGLRAPDTAPSVAPSFAGYEELPLFPLPLVLNPGSTIPLHIFEMRYRLMFNRIRDGDSRFGIVFYDQERDAIAEVGCAAELTRFEPLPDGSGRIMTNSIARRRFRIVNILEEKPYKRALVEFFDDNVVSSEDTELHEMEEKVWAALQDVLRLSNKLYDRSLDLGSSIRGLAPATDRAASTGSVDEDKELSQRSQDFSFAVSQVLDMPVDQQQRLLQTRSTRHRLQKQGKMLDTARQYLAAQVTIKEAGLSF